MIVILQSLILLLSSFFIKLDDAYIFYNYAKNLAEGNGYVFNLNEKINATTSIIYTFLLALFYLPFQPHSEIVIPIIGNFISILSLLFTALMMKELFSDELKEVKYILPVIFLSMPLIKNAIGMETFFKMMLMIILLIAYTKQKLILMNISGAVLILTRPDTVILIIIVVISYFLSNKNFLNLKTSFIPLIIILTYIISSSVYFGHVIPSSLKVKIIQRDLDIINGNFFEGFVMTFPGGEKIASVFFSFIFISLIILVKKEKVIFKNEILKILLIYFLTYTLIYGLILNPPSYPWYYTDFIILYSLVITFFLKFLIGRFKLSSHNSISIVLVLIISMVGLVIPFKIIKQGYNEKFLLYKNTAVFLNSISGENTKLACDEIGILGFYYKGKIIDELGLITPEALKALTQKNFLLTIKATTPEFVMIDLPNYPKYKSYITDKWFSQNYSNFFTMFYSKSGVRIYRRNDYNLN